MSETPLEKAYREGAGLGGLDAAGVKRLVETSRRNEDLADAVARGKREILADVAAGRVPPPASFSELHDHVDANEYGGLCDTYGDFETYGNEFANDVQDALDEWIRDGGAEGAR